MISRFARSAALALLVMATMPGCHDEPTGPEPLHGTYVATTMTMTPNDGETVDLLAEGASLTITFGSGYTMTGTLSMPGEEEPANMAGTYIRRRNSLEFVQDADTFVRELTWSIGANTLTASDQEVDTTVFDVVLTQQVQAATTGQ